MLAVASAHAQTGEWPAEVGPLLPDGARAVRRRSASPVSAVGGTGTTSGWSYVVRPIDPERISLWISPDAGTLVRAVDSVSATGNGLGRVNFSPDPDDDRLVVPPTLTILSTDAGALTWTSDFGLDDLALRLSHQMQRRTPSGPVSPG